MRIISLCPSITETLFHFNLENQIVGRTKFCIHPKPQIQKVERVGGTKSVDFEKINNLNPDLIILEKEENTLEIYNELMDRNLNVHVCQVQNVQDSYKMILELGELTHKTLEAKKLIEEIQIGFNEIPKISKSFQTAYFIWKNPWMVVGKNTYIQSILKLLGLQNPFIEFDSRYPEINIEQLDNQKIELMLFSTEPYRFKESHILEFQKSHPNIISKLVDGEMFTWYGYHQLLAIEYLKKFAQTINLHD